MSEPVENTAANMLELENADGTTTAAPVLRPPPTPFSMATSLAVAKREEKGTVVLHRDEHGEPLYTMDDSGELVRAQSVVLGKLSGTFRKAEQAINDRMIKRRTAELTADMVDRHELEKIAACIRSWNFRDGTKPIPLTVNNAAMVMTVAPWIRRDYTEAMNDSARFLG